MLEWWYQAQLWFGVGAGLLLVLVTLLLGVSYGAD